MSARVRKTNLRWIAPAAAAGLVIASPSLWASLASAEPPLPPRSADEIIAGVLAVRPMAFSGEVSQTMQLGLPQFPFEANVDFANPNSMWSLASGSNTWRLWHDGDQSYRVAIIRGQSESDLISNGHVMWAWSSDSQQAVRTELPAGETTPPEDQPLPVPVPTDTAKEILREVEQYSTVATDANVRVAGRAAYELVITPTDDTTRVAQLRVAVDAETSLPLRLQVFSTGSAEPAIEIAFTKINYGAQNASTFEFTPPPGAEVIEASHPEVIEGEQQTPELPPAEVGPEAQGEPPVRSIGEGWSQIAIAEPGTQMGEVTANPVFAQLPHVQGEWGSGVVLDGALVSIVFSDDGRVAMGAVPAEALYEALAK